MRPSYTSLAANAASKELKIIHWQLILDSLKYIDKGTFEQIAAFAKLTPNQVARRLKELEGDVLKGMAVRIIKLDEKRPTSTGRMAYLYQIK